MQLHFHDKKMKKLADATESEPMSCLYCLMHSIDMHSFMKYYDVLAVALVPMRPGRSSGDGGKAAAPQPKRLQPGRVVLVVPEGWNGTTVIEYFQTLVGVARQDFSMNLLLVPW
jgi:hypothetical protein